MADHCVLALDFTISDMDSEFLLGAAIGNVSYYESFKDQPTSMQALYEYLMQHIVTAQHAETFKLGALLGFFSASAGATHLRWLGTDDEHRHALYRERGEHKSRPRKSRRGEGPSPPTGRSRAVSSTPNSRTHRAQQDQANSRERSSNHGRAHRQP